LPAGISSKIKSIEIGGEEVKQAFALQSIVVQLTDDIDVSRGDLIVNSKHQPDVTQELDVLLCWMDSKPLRTGNKYLLQINSRQIKSVLKEIDFKLDVNTLEKHVSPQSIGMNDVVRAKIRTASPAAVDKYSLSKATGSAVLIDETSHNTEAASKIE
jgi:sulfate adenylyltransferase subunit 1